MPEAFRENLKSFSRREFPAFENREGSFDVAGEGLNIPLAC